MKSKFEPELSGGSLIAQNAALINPDAAKGKAIFEGKHATHATEITGSVPQPAPSWLESAANTPPPSSKPCFTIQPTR